MYPSTVNQACQAQSTSVAAEATENAEEAAKMQKKSLAGNI